MDIRIEEILDSLISNNRYSNNEKQEKWNNYMIQFQQVYEYLGNKLPELYKNFNFAKFTEEVNTLKN